MSCSLPAAGFASMTEMPSVPASFLSCAGTLAAWYADPHAVVTDLAHGRELFRQSATPHLHGGHSPQLEAALAPDGSVLAMCCKPGEVTLHDVGTGQERAVWRGAFQMISKLAFTPSGGI